LDENNLNISLNLYSVNFKNGLAAKQQSNVLLAQPTNIFLQTFFDQQEFSMSK